MTSYLNSLRKRGYRPHAQARIQGSSAYPSISGMVYFYQTARGVIVAVEAWNLPKASVACADRIFGFHIHSGSQCTGNETDAFADAGMHFNPGECPHPFHAGDLPPLFGNHGYGFQMFLTDRFTVQEILDKTVIIHSAPDDFTSQPAGNAGEKIACGRIEALEIRR